MTANTNATVLPLNADGLNGVGLAQKIILRRFSQLAFGSLRVIFKQGIELSIEAKHAGPAASIHIERPWALLRAIVIRGDLGFAEAYMRGDWRCEDLSGLLYLLSMNLEAFQSMDKRSLPVRIAARWQHVARRNSLKGSRKNIAAHYDLGNDFYQRWLDSTMSYSSAVFDQSTDLAQAQQRKYQLMLEALDAQPGAHILEIGCGWGGFAEYAAQQGMRVTGITLSKEQLAYAQQRIQQAGLSGQVDLQLIDYRDLQGQFDHIVSIEMFEAVGEAYWQGYFKMLDRCLRPGGRVALQVITIREDLFETYRRDAGGFIQRYIFPGGMLPTEWHLRKLGQASGLETLSMTRYGEDYADTLAHWMNAFNQQTSWLEQHGYDQRFRRMWRYYLAFCEGGFRDGRIDLVHHCLQKA